MDCTAAHCDGYSPRCSCTNRTARSRTSGENLLFLLMAPFSQKLEPPQNSVRFKTDARDAQAIWVAAQQPHIRAVPVKSEQQQACLALHRMRAQLMKMRIMQTNALRGLLYEFGIVLPEGHQAS